MSDPFEGSTSIKPLIFQKCAVDFLCFKTCFWIKMAKNVIFIHLYSIMNLIPPQHAIILGIISIIISLLIG